MLNNASEVKTRLSNLLSVIIVKFTNPNDFLTLNNNTLPTVKQCIMKEENKAKSLNNSALIHILCIIAFHPFAVLNFRMSEIRSMGLV